MFSQKQIEEMVELLYDLDENTKIYLGCDSVRFKKDGRRYAKFATVAVVHMNGKNGCRVFRHKSVEPDYDMKSSRPSMRLMNEVQKVCELYVQLAPFIDSFPIEIHLDVNVDPKHGSNCVAQQAAGYVISMTGIEPKLKPDAFSSSFAADHYANSYANSYTSND